MVGLITILKQCVVNCIIILYLNGELVSVVIIIIVFIYKILFVMEASLILVNVLIQNLDNKIKIVILIKAVYTYNVVMKHIKPFYYLQPILQESNITQDKDQCVMMIGHIKILKLYVENYIIVLWLHGYLDSNVTIIIVFIQIMQFVMEVSSILINVYICHFHNIIVILIQNAYTYNAEIKII